MQYYNKQHNRVNNIVNTLNTVLPMVCEFASNARITAVDLSYQKSLKIYAPYDKIKYEFLCIIRIHYNTIIFYILIVYYHATFKLQ